MALDLSPLQDLVLLFNTFMQAFTPIQLILTFVAFIAAIAGGAAIWFKWKMGRLVGESNDRPLVRKKARKVQFLAIAVITLFILSAASFSTPGAAVNGSLEVGVTSIMGDTPLTVKAKSLDASTAYAIYWGSTAIINWTTSASAENRIVTFEAASPATGRTVILYLYSAATTVDSLTFYINEAGDFLPTTFLISLGITVLIIVVIVGVIISVRRKGS